MMNQNQITIEFVKVNTNRTTENEKSIAKSVGDG